MPIYEQSVNVRNCVLLGLEPAKSQKSVIFGMNLPQRGISP